MKEQPLVSIITPTYNHELFIRECINSVIAQTYPRFEQIVIDDGSTDSTGKIVESYSDNRIVLVSQENKGIEGLAETYNKALSRSKGDLIAILEGDDFWPPCKLEKQIPSFRREDIVLSWGKVIKVDSEGNEMLRFNIKSRRLDDSDQIDWTRELLLEGFIPACTVMCRKEALLSIDGFKQPRDTSFVDLPTWLELSRIGNFAPIDEFLGYWRRHKDSITSNRRFRMVEEANNIKLEFLDSLPSDSQEKLCIDRRRIKAIKDIKMGNVHFDKGRKDLIEENCQQARRHFLETMRKGGFKKKGKAFIGFVSAVVHVNMEWLAKGTNRYSIK